MARFPSSLLLSLFPLYRYEITRFTLSNRQKLIHGPCEILGPSACCVADSSVRPSFDIGHLTGLCKIQLQLGTKPHRDPSTCTQAFAPSKCLNKDKNRDLSSTYTDSKQMLHGCVDEKVGSMIWSTANVK